MEELTLVLVFALCALSYARASYNSNMFISTVLYGRLPDAARDSNVDPAQIGNFTIQYTDEGISKTDVKIDYYFGNMTGLLDVRRLGNCSRVIRMYETNELSCMLTFKNIRFAYQGRMVRGNSPPENINVQANMSQTNAFVEIFSATWRNNSILKSLRFVNIGIIKSKHTGSSGSSDSMKNEQRDSAFAGMVLNEFNKIFNDSFIPSLKSALWDVRMPVV